MCKRYLPERKNSTASTSVEVITSLENSYVILTLYYR